jgi:AAA domain
MSRNGTPIKDTTRYEYTNFRTKEKVIKTRIDYVDGSKSFTWPTGTKMSDLHLYGRDDLRRLQKDEPVLLVEGEKTADALSRYGFVAVSLPGGAGQSDLDALNVIRYTGNPVFLCPDNDEPGIALMRRAYDHLRGYPLVRWVPPPVQEPGGDFADLLAPYTEDAAAREAVLDAISSATEGPPQTTVAEDPEDGLIPMIGMANALAMPETPVQWVADGLINAGGLSILVGPYKGGKSTLLRILCACVATGHPFLGREIQQGRVGYVGLEERFDDVMRHFRTLFTGTDEAMQNLAFVSAGDDWVPGKLEDRFDVIEATIERYQLTLLAIGPIQDLVQFGNTNDYAEVKTKMRGLKKLGDRTNCTIIADHHMNKYGIGRNALLGSVAFGAVADQVFYLPFDKEAGVRGFFSDQRVGISIDEPLGIDYDREGIESNLGPPPERMKAAMAQQKLLDQVLEFCAEDRRTRDDITQALGARRVSVIAAIARGVSEGLLDEQGKGVKNDPTTYLSVSVPARGNVIPFPESNGTE